MQALSPHQITLAAAYDKLEIIFKSWIASSSRASACWPDARYVGLRACCRLSVWLQALNKTDMAPPALHESSSLIEWALAPCNLTQVVTARLSQPSLARSAAAGCELGPT